MASAGLTNGLVFASTTAGLNVFDAATGDPLWIEQGKHALYSQPVVLDGAVYCTYLNGDVVAFRVPAPSAP